MKARVWSFLIGLVAVASVVAAFASGTAGEADAAAVLGEEDLAERAEILRNQFRRMTPGDAPLVQDIGTWPAAWEEFGRAWDVAPATRDLATWLVPFSAERTGAATVIRDVDGTVLWYGQTDFAKEESASVTLTGWLVSEDDWPLYEAARAALSRRLASQTPRLRNGEGGGAGNELTGLRFVSVAADFTNTPPSFRVGLKRANTGTVDVFAYGPWHVQSNSVVTYTNDENAVVTCTNTTWYSTEPGLTGLDSHWVQVGVVAFTNDDEVVFVDNTFPMNRGIVRAECDDLQSIDSHTGGLEIYCVRNLDNDAVGLTYMDQSAAAGLTIANTATPGTLAHELGHACGLDDIYTSRPSQNPTVFFPANATNAVAQNWEPNDWCTEVFHGGYGMLTQSNLIHRLLMYGVDETDAVDIPAGTVRGLDSDGHTNNIAVGISGLGNRQPMHW